MEPMKHSDSRLFNNVALAATMVVSMGIGFISVRHWGTGSSSSLFQGAAVGVRPATYPTIVAPPSSPVGAMHTQGARYQHVGSQPRIIEATRDGIPSENSDVTVLAAPGPSWLYLAIAGYAAVASCAVALSGRQSVAMASLSGEKGISSADVEFDGEAVVRYLGATSLQFGLVVVALLALDQVNGYLVAGLGAPELVAKVVVTLFFAFTSVRSRVFSPLDNSRPSVAKEGEAIEEKRRPSWMPPPLTFPIVWSTIAVLRTISGVMIWSAADDTLVVTPILIYFLTLCIGDTWNTINNVEKRTGTAVLGVGCVWTSALATNYLYYDFLPKAGLVLGFQQIWLTIASVLVFSIWRLNGAEPLYPFKLKA